MDYLKHYNLLVATRKKRVLDQKVYYERHHIIPRCIGGTDNEDNLVYLTFKEHYMAHYLLSKIYQNVSSIQYAFLCMLRDPHGKRVITSSIYKTIKENYRQFQSWRFTHNNPMRTDTAKEKHSKRMKDNNPQHKPGNKCRRFNESPSKGKKAYNNGMKNAYFIENTQPTGWYPGLLKYNRYWTPNKKERSS